MSHFLKIIWKCLVFFLLSLLFLTQNGPYLHHATTSKDMPTAPPLFPFWFMLKYMTLFDYIWGVDLRLWLTAKHLRLAQTRGSCAVRRTKILAFCPDIRQQKSHSENMHTVVSVLHYLPAHRPLQHTNAVHDRTYIRLITQYFRPEQARGSCAVRHMKTSIHPRCFFLQTSRCAHHTTAQDRT